MISFKCRTVQGNLYILKENILKHLLLALCFFHSYTYASLIEEEVFIDKPSESLIKLIAQHPELTIDHMDDHGMELYGPKGTKEWLEMLEIKFHKLSHHDGHEDKQLDNKKYPTYEEIEKFLKENQLISENKSKAYIMPNSRSIDIDDLNDLKMAEYFFKQDYQFEQ